jgi:hypothetical protein
MTSTAGESLGKHVDFNLNFAEGDEASAEERKKNGVVDIMPMHDPGRIRTSVSPQIIICLRLIE